MLRRRRGSPKFPARRVLEAYRSWRGARDDDSRSADDAITAVVSFWEEAKPADATDWGGEEDWMIVEWGPTFGTDGRELELHIVRQVADQEGNLWQLAIDLSYDAKTVAKATGSSKIRGCDWCLTGNELLEATSALRKQLEGLSPLSSRVWQDPPDVDADVNEDGEEMAQNAKEMNAFPESTMKNNCAWQNWRYMQALTLHCMMFLIALTFVVLIFYTAVGNLKNLSK